MHTFSDIHIFVKTDRHRREQDTESERKCEKKCVFFSSIRCDCDPDFHYCVAIFQYTDESIDSFDEKKHASLSSRQIK